VCVCVCVCDIWLEEFVFFCASTTYFSSRWYVYLDFFLITLWLLFCPNSRLAFILENIRFLSSNEVSLPSMGSFTITIRNILLNDNMWSTSSTCGTTHAPNEIHSLCGLLASACFLCTTNHKETINIHRYIESLIGTSTWFMVNFNVVSSHTFLQWSFNYKT
jgi:hypothetical protein